MRILFLETDAVTSEVRLRPLLDQLSQTGAIEAYAVVDRDMSVRPKKLSHYDVALTNRIPNARQLDWLRRHRPPLVYDIDDLLPGPWRQNSERRRREEDERLDWCLRHAEAIASPSPRLIAALAQRFGQELRGRAHLLFNCGCENPPAPRSPGRPKLFWASSATHRWTDELGAIAAGIDAAARELGVEIDLVGQFPAALYQALSRAPQRPGWVPFGRFMEGLAAGPLVAVAPLACGPSADEQAFLDCKSDIKAAQYGSSRIAAVYSPAAPYRESDLPINLAAANSFAAWREAAGTLIEGFPASGNALGDHPAFLARRPSAVAMRLLGLFESVRRSDRPPFSFRAIPTPRLGRSLDRGLRSLRARFAAKA